MQIYMKWEISVQIKKSHVKPDIVLIHSKVPIWELIKAFDFEQVANLWRI